MEQLDRITKATEIIISIENILSTFEVIICSGHVETFCKVSFKNSFIEEEKEVIIKEFKKLKVKKFQFIKDDTLTFSIR